MTGLEITWGRVLKIWWSWTWRSIAIGVPFGVAVGILWFWVERAILRRSIAGNALPPNADFGQLVGSQDAMATYFGSLAIYEGLYFLAVSILGVAINIWMLKVAIELNYSDFRVVFVRAGMPPRSDRREPSLDF